MEKRVTKKLTVVSGKKYLSVMYWHSLPKTHNISASSNNDRDMLKTLLAEMALKAMYRTQMRRYDPYSIVGRDRSGKNIGTHYRIDNQTRVNLDNPKPILNLHYQIGDRSHAMVVVHMKPSSAPEGRENELIDNANEGGLGFQPKTVMGFIEDALKYSAENDCYTHIEWFVSELEDEKRERRRSGDRPRIHVAASMANIIQCVIKSFTERHRVQAISVCGLKVVAKTVAKESVEIAAKLVIKELAKESGKAASKTLGKELLSLGAKATANKIPVVGLLVGGVFGTFRLLKGDVEGASLEFLSGAASCVPGVGTATSVAIDVALFARDINQAQRHGWNL